MAGTCDTVVSVMISGLVIGVGVDANVSASVLVVPQRSFMVVALVISVHTGR